jgi:hypothetical protein
MTAWLFEVWVIFTLSRKTQAAIALGVVSFVLVRALGSYEVGQIQFGPPLESLSTVVRELLADRYGHAAWLALGSWFALAAKCYRKDRRRLLR